MALDRSGTVASYAQTNEGTGYWRLFERPLISMLAWGAVWLNDPGFAPHVDAVGELRALGSKYQGSDHVIHL